MSNLPETQKSQKTSEFKNPPQDVQGAFDTTVNFRVFAFVSLGMPEKLTSDSLNAYKGVFDKTESAVVTEIGQQKLDQLIRQFSDKETQFNSDHKKLQKEKDAAKFSSKVKAAASTVSEGAKKAAITVSEGAKNAATTVSKGVNDTAQKLVGFVDKKTKERAEAAETKAVAAKAAAETKAAAEAKEAAETEAALREKAIESGSDFVARNDKRFQESRKALTAKKEAAEAKARAELEKKQAEADANAKAEAEKKAKAETRVIWLNRNTPASGVIITSPGKENIKLIEGDFITFKGFTEADGSVISSALIRRFEGNQMATIKTEGTEGPENMWFIPWVMEGDIGNWGGELFSKCSPNLFQRSLGQKERTIEWVTVAKSEKPSRAPPLPELLPPKDVTKKETKPLLQQSVTTNPNDPLWAASDEEDETVAAATAAAAEAGGWTLSEQVYNRRKYG